MPDSTGYDDATAGKVGGRDPLHMTDPLVGDLLRALLTGQLADGTPVYPPGQVFGENNNGTIGALMRDIVTGAAQVIPVEHVNVHLKRAFSLSSHVAVASGQTAAIRFVTPAASVSYTHLTRVQVGCTAGPFVATLLEDYTATGTFSDVPPMNRNRNAPPASGLTVTGSANASLTAGSAPITVAELYLPGSSTAQRVGGEAATYEEIVLKPQTTYILAMLNSTSPGVTATAYYNVNWYEEPAGG